MSTLTTILTPPTYYAMSVDQLRAAIVFLAVAGDLSFPRVKGIRHFFRNFTALAVKEHLRSQIEDAGSRAELTPKEIELVRFAADRSDQLSELANKPRR
jgi:hypothetical protein